MQIASCPVLGLADEWPSTLFVGNFAGTDCHICWKNEHNHFGLAVCEIEEMMQKVANLFADDQKIVRLSVTFEMARQIAKGKPKPLNCIHLLVVDGGKIRVGMTHFVK